MLGLRQLTLFAGPVMAGGLIALVGDSKVGQVTSYVGIGCAFLVNTGSFVISTWTLHRTALLPGSDSVASATGKHVLHDVAEGLRHCWNDLSLRTCFLYWAAIMLLIAGPVQVAMPVLATNLGDNAAGFGMLVGANAAGSLLGMVLSGVLPRFGAGRLGATILTIDCIAGLLFMPMGHISAIWQGVLILLTIGTLSGFMQVGVYTWMQKRVPRSMLGRTMSIFMFIFMGITPVSAAVTGWLMRSLTTAQVFSGAGALLVGIVLIALVSTPMRRIAGNG
jgi:hypothetical protein